MPVAMFALRGLLGLLVSLVSSSMGPDGSVPVLKQKHRSPAGSGNIAAAHRKIHCCAAAGPASLLTTRANLRATPCCFCICDAPPDKLLYLSKSAWQLKISSTSVCPWRPAQAGMQPTCHHVSHQLYTPRCHEGHPVLPRGPGSRVVCVSGFRRQQGFCQLQQAPTQTPAGGAVQQGCQVTDAVHKTCSTACKSDRPKEHECTAPCRPLKLVSLLKRGRRQCKHWRYPKPHVN